MQGNSHAVYSGSFYYNVRNKPKIVKMDLETRKTIELTVPFIDTNSSSHLYTSDFTYMDFSVDDNGLWVIYGLPDTNNTAVLKVLFCGVF